MCDNDECTPIVPGEVTPKPLPEQSGGGGIEIVSTLPSVHDAKEGIIYLYLTDESDASTFSGAYVLDKKAGQLINISDESGDNHIYTFEDTTNGFKVLQDGTEIYEYVAPTPKTYTNGNGLNLSNDEFSIDTNVVATKTDLEGKQDTLTPGANINIDEEGNISATDTTYGDFVGTDGQTVGSAGLVPAPTTTDVDKFLKGDGTWAAAGGGGGESMHRLTQDDFNWNSSTGTTVNPNCVALWLLDTGWYYIAREDSSLGGQPANVPIQITESQAASADQLIFCVGDAPQQANYKDIIVIGSMTTIDGDGGFGYRVYRVEDTGGSGWLSGIMATMSDVRQYGVTQIMPWSYQDFPSNNPDGTAVFRLDPGMYKVFYKGKMYLNDSYSIDGFIGTISVFEYENRDSETVRGIIAINTNEAGGGNYVGETKYNGTKVYLSKMDSTAL